MTNIDLIGELQGVVNAQSLNIKLHGVALVDSSLLLRSIECMKLGYSSTFSTLNEYLKDGETLTPTEYVLLELLIAAGGEAVSYAELNAKSGIASGVNGSDLDSLWVHKCRLARKLKADYEIGTVRKRGYVLLRGGQ